MTHREKWAQRKSQMAELATLMRVRTGDTEDGDAMISGRRGTIHDLGQGGFVVAYFGLDGKSMTKAKGVIAKVKGHMFLECGFGECTFTIPDLPDRRGATALRNLLEVSKVRECPENEHARLLALSIKHSPLRKSNQKHL